MALACPPEGVALHVLVNLELRTCAETLVKTESGTVLLEQCVDTRKTTVPAVLQILQG